MSKFLDIEGKALRKPQSFTLLPSSLARVKEAADLHNTNQSRIVEALIIRYLPGIITAAKQELADASA